MQCPGRSTCEAMRRSSRRLDESSSTARTCGCGLPYPTLPFQPTRKFGTLLKLDGTRISPMIMQKIALKLEHGSVSRFQVIQHDFKEFTIKIVQSKNRKLDSEQNKISQFLSEYLDYNVKVQLLVVEDIPLTKSGKYQIVYSELTRDKSRFK